MKFLKLTFFLSFLGVPVFFYYQYSDKLSAFVEKDLPEVQIQSDFPGFGLNHRSIKLQLSDRGSGLDSVTVKIEQGNISKQLFSKNYHGSVLTDEIEFEVKPRELNLKEGEATIKATVFDKSFFSNLTKASFNVKLDFTKPQITIFEGQHNASTGGSELVFYKLKESALKITGVKYRDRIFRGFPAKNIDDFFVNKPDIYVAFFPIPEGVSTNDKELKVYAEDLVGNSVSEEFFYRVSKQTYRNINRSVADELFNEKIKELKDHEVAQKRLEEVFAQPIEKKYWIDNFSRIPAREVKGFGQTIVYSSTEKETKPLSSNETFYTALLNAPISATNNGVVVYADTLPVMGKTLILDHGLGFTSVYAGLNKFLKNKGDSVERGELVGIVGETGFSFLPQLNYQIRIHGVSVKPSEWSDAYWVRDHLELKIDKIKALYR